MHSNREDLGSSVGPAAEVRLVDVLSTVQRWLVRDLTARLECEAVTVDQWRTLRSIGSGPGISMGELADRLQMPPASVTRLTDSLVDRAEVYRHQSVRDRRRVGVYLSPNGRCLLERLESIVSQHEQAMTRGISVDDIARITRTLVQFVEIAGNARGAIGNNNFAGTADLETNALPIVHS